MQRLLKASVLISAALLPLTLYARKPPALTPTLLVVNQTSHDLSLIDAATGRRVDSIDVMGTTGHEVVATSDGQTAFVPIYGNSGVGKAGTDGQSITVVDLARRKVTGTIKFSHGVRPHCAVYDQRRKMLYVTTELDKSVSIIDPANLQIVGSIPTGQEQSHMLVLSHNGRFGYTANVGPGTVSVLDMNARRTLAVIPIAAQVQRIAISRDDKLVFTADETTPRLAVIDTATNRRTAWIPLPAVGYGTAATRDGRWLLVAMPNAHQLAVVDLKTSKVTRTIDLPDKPTEVLERPDGKVAYISCGSMVAMLDLTTWKLNAPIQAGQGADGLGWAQ